MSLLIRVVLVVLGILAVIVGILYLVEPVHSLPSFFPGYAAHSQIHHHTRGYLAIAVGVILLIFAAVAGRSRRRDYYR
jgi:NADH:ubiquinone oxidoreductase subunit 5 (subunit L)/multisubunit Na+/H+ antiporter MnhA subunit